MGYMLTPESEARQVFRRAQLGFPLPLQMRSRSTCCHVFLGGAVFLLGGEAKIERMLGASRDELRVKLEKNQLESEDLNDLRGLASTNAIFDMCHSLPQFACS